MKRVVLLRRIADEGAVFVRHGADHDVYRNVITGVMESIPRHRNSSRHRAIVSSWTIPVSFDPPITFFSSK